MGKPTERWAHQKSREELEAALARQLGHMRRSAQIFDDGVLEEAERLASVAYILLHDGRGRTKSLLGQLGLKHRLRLFDTTRPPPPPGHIALQNAKLCSLRLAVGPDNEWAEVNYVPAFHHAKSIDDIRLIPFSKWIDQPIYQSAKGFAVTRKNLITSLRDQGGGGHVDAEITHRDYHWLSSMGEDNFFLEKSEHTDNAWALAACLKREPDDSLTPVQGKPIFKNGHWASMRQVTWELDESLKRIGL